MAFSQNLNCGNVLVHSINTDSRLELTLSREDDDRATGKK